ncbi:hypothetical protein RJT34_11054 [Clitoria ternatea]|uniref:Non-specific lipid-transfer protein n=1 Tax=Clitoria ternatea TaxID=43366 RepID=A0AAN9PJP2_CLITE
MKGFAVFVTVLVVSVYANASEAEPTFDCESAKESLSPCLGYVTGATSVLSSACCNGINQVKAHATTREDRHIACHCLKEASTHVPPNFNLDLAISLPKQCGLLLPFPITKNMNCNSHCALLLLSNKAIAISLFLSLSLSHITFSASTEIHHRPHECHSHFTPFSLSIPLISLLYLRSGYLGFLN